MQRFKFYNPFKKDVDNTIETAQRISGEREIGTDPVSKKPIIARMGKYGPMVQIGTSEDEEKPRYAKLKASQSIETISDGAVFHITDISDLYIGQLCIGLCEVRPAAVYTHHGQDHFIRRCGLTEYREVKDLNT